MSFLEKVKNTVRERPKRSLFAVSMILAWLLVPLVSQMYFNYSAIKISFTITVLYYAGWKLYELQTGSR